jgi:MMP endo-(1,4)-3-O-methyl-alpha-D-mannosidase
VSGHGHPLGAAERERTAAWLATQQLASGEIPWSVGGKTDPWDHLHAAMGLALAGRRAAAVAAIRWLVQTQDADGGWPAERRGGTVTCTAHETNHAAYIATALWYVHCVRADVDLLAATWPTVARAIDFVVGMQDETGAVSWLADDQGRVWRSPILGGSSSIYGSLVCALRIAARLGHDRPEWRRARERLARVLRDDVARFDRVDLPEKPGRFAMDWYYPVLGGAVRGAAGRARLLDPARAAAFVTEGVGVRCLRGRPWYTAAETCEYVLALAACGLTIRARQIFSWVHRFRVGSGGYFTGIGHPDHGSYPEGEETSYTAATVLMAADALAGESPTGGFFRDLAGDDLDADAGLRAARSRSPS